MLRDWRWAAILLGLAILPGCGGGEVADDGGDEAVVEETPTINGIKHRSAEKLPKVGDHLPPLDGGKVEVAAPAGWNTLSRSSKSLASFAKGKASELPRITISAADSPDPAVSELTAENYEQMAAVILKQMQSGDKKPAILEPSLPIYLGDILYLRHVRKAQLSGTPVVIQSLQTIHDGRLYSVELMAEIDAARSEEYEASLKKYRDYGYAVAANMKFGGSAAPGEIPALPAPAEATPAALPAEATP